MKPSNTETQDIERQIIGSEQAADLAALTAAASEGAAQPGAPVAEPEPAGPDLAQEIAGLVTVAVATLGPLFPSLRTTYTPEVTQAAAESIARVCDKHGWLQGGMMGKWGEEIACAAIVGPLAFQTYQGVKADLEARKPPAEPARIAGPDLTAPAPTEAAGATAVTFSEPVGAAA